jgi:TATA-binding protein-associated factor
VDWVCSQAWSYCVLDEGHAIRNPASRVAQAAKRAGLAAAHRLLLSGTPVQNSVGELWSLFDFLMPGLLGSQRQFHARCGRLVQVWGWWRRRGGGRASSEPCMPPAGPRLPCTPAVLGTRCKRTPSLASQAARGSKRGSAEAEAGLLAAEGLHRAVRPFILRRTKAAVLADLPPKVVQDVVVEPSQLQQHLMQELQDSQVGAVCVRGGGDWGAGLCRGACCSCLATSETSALA